MSVYFARVGRYFKIGYSSAPERRVRRLFASTTRYGAPPDAPLGLASRELVRAIDGDKGTEFRIHRALDEFRVRGEWFLDEPEVRAFIDAAHETDLDRDYERVPRPAGAYWWADDPVFSETEDEKRALERAMQNMFGRGDSPAA